MRAYYETTGLEGTIETPEFVELEINKSLLVPRGAVGALLGLGACLPYPKYELG